MKTKLLTFFIGAVGLLSTTNAQNVTQLVAGKDFPAEIEDPECIGINKEPAHATLMPYASLDEALKAKRHESSFCRVLNGLWKFNWVAWPNQRPVDFYKPDFDVSGWKEIPVPSNWQVLGYGTPYYRNMGYTFKIDFPHVMSEPSKDYTAYEERNPVGSYRRDFDVPADWNGRRVFITFDGVDAAFFIWVNGQKVGYSTNSRNAAEFDITKYVKPGKNMVAVEVYRYCSGSYLEDQDMWRLSGIFRNVTLWSSPQTHVRDYFVQTDLDKEYNNSTVSVSAKIKNYSSQASQAQKLQALLYNGNEPVEGTTATANIPVLKPGQETIVSLKFMVNNPQKWTAETPKLYTTVLTLQDSKGTNEILSSRTGFRKIEIKGRQLLVNGTPIKLKGVNRHEHWSDVGHAVTEEQMIRDLEIIKQGNCNHVRTCHYSDDPRWYELCDEWGIWLVAEANVECHGCDGKFDEEPRMKAAIIDRNVANVENFKNHPSVIIWSLGNECGRVGSNFVSAMNKIKSIDPTRFVHYERFGIGKNNPSDFDGKMYGTPDEFARIAQNKDLTKPFYICEFAHAMFNSMGSLEEYSKVFDNNQEIVGGAIWEYQDQALWNKRDPNHPILAYGGGFGEFPNDHYFIHKGVVAWDRKTTKPHYPEMKKAYQWIETELIEPGSGTIRIRNKFQFTSLDAFDASWTLTENGKEIDKGTLQLPRIWAFRDGRVAVPYKIEHPKAGAEYFLRISYTQKDKTLWADKGFEVASEQFKLPVNTPPAEETKATSQVKVTQDAQSIKVTGTGFAVTFDKNTGLMSQLQKDGVNLLTSDGSPKLHLWRAAHRNDDMWANRDWDKFGVNNLKCSLVDMKVENIDKYSVKVISTTKYDGKEGFGAYHTSTYTIKGDGSVKVDNKVNFVGLRINLAHIGVRMLLDKKLDKMAYFGRGPIENYADRKSGADVGLYELGVNDQYEYEKPMDRGNHEDVRWVKFTGNNMPDFVVNSDENLMQVSALPHTDEQMFPVEYKIDLPVSTATVFCLSSKTLGVGSAGCGPRPLEKYQVWSDNAQFTYTIQLLK